MDGTMALRPLAILGLETLYWRSGIIYTPNGLFDGRSQRGPVTVSSLHTNLQIANFQRCTHTHSTSIRCEWDGGWPSISYCWRSFTSTISYLSPLLSDSSCLFTRCQLPYASCCTLLLYFSRYCTARFKMFSFCGFFCVYYLCEKYYKPITIRYYIADCVSWVRRLTLLDLKTNWIYECTLEMELGHI